MPPAEKKKKLLPVFFEISCGGRWLGRVVIELFDRICPKTCQNFRTLCTGEAGMSTLGTPLHYKGSSFFRIIPNFLIQGGDVTHNDGTGGECIWAQAQGGEHNRYFEDENFQITHASCGLLSMANEGPHTNQSQFFITCAPCPWLDGRNVVFGRVVKGHETLSVVEGLGTPQGFIHADVRISDCGICSEEEATAVMSTLAYPSAEVPLSEIPVREDSSADSQHHPLSSVGNQGILPTAAIPMSAVIINPHARPATAT